MGQYYTILNIDRKEKLEPFSFGCGMKLMEWSYQGNHLVLALSNLLKAGGRWAGDRVLVCGDYAEAEEDCPEENKDVWDNAYIQAAKELGFYGKTYQREDNSNITYKVTLYGFANEHFTELKPADCSLAKSGTRYVINHAKKVYVDTKHCPIERVWVDEDTKKSGAIKIAPLSLLLAMGNGMGGGDYYRNSVDNNVASLDLVGSWANDAGKIEVAGKAPKGYTEFVPNFTKNGHPIPWDSEKALIAEKLNALEKN